MQDFLLSASVEPLVIILLFTLPIAVTIIGITKHIIGLKSLSVFISLAMIFVFFEFATDTTTNTIDIQAGLRYGLVLFFLTFILATVAYGIIKSLALHYYPKLALVISFVSFGYLAILFLADYFNVMSLINFNLFALLLSALISERIMNLLARKPFKTAVMAMLESTVTASLCFIVIALPSVQSFIINYPLSLILLFPINYFVGRFTGLRIREYIRFRDILNEDQ
ncbi:MAG: 7TM domain-containing protein [Candidatus Dojkabacteria bacterium]|uniref:7 transmembrane helices usually fused to an inactive transglutaminase domain-containing protein n=2 Tax=Candidatus Dojkabacteria TaxID=74243 RepID=A0A136KEM2_9BACT|nr:MAG: hypothetical protein UZ20_WS6002001076 [candidate division WS6 bacterium OLB21]MBW7953275.1 hypothetical protein [Candidatus Dojkabacteria bacterium]WKZ28417.1 MAG: 7TM domain-containing protein [Candidatus Dojkabacteria bacterium]